MRQTAEGTDLRRGVSWGGEPSAQGETWAGKRQRGGGPAAGGACVGDTLSWGKEKWGVRQGGPLGRKLTLGVMDLAGTIGVSLLGFFCNLPPRRRTGETLGIISIYFSICLSVCLSF